MRLFYGVLGVCLLCVSVFAMGGQPPAKPLTVEVGQPILISDFSNGASDWWFFDLKKDTTDGKLVFKGQAKDWYVGGCGVYVAKERQDLGGCSALCLDIYGNGPASGTLKIELFDDDNNNWQCEQDPAKNYANTKDDKFVYEQRIDWTGMQTIVIPFADFTDDNPMVGDDIWNPQQSGNSGGLLQMQFVGLATSKTGKIDFAIDNICVK